MPADADQVEALARTIASLLTSHGESVTAERITDLLWEAGLGDALEDLAVARTVIRAADGFHPVARFFAEGSAEHELIRRMLHDAG